MIKKAIIKNIRDGQNITLIMKNGNILTGCFYGELSDLNIEEKIVYIMFKHIYGGSLEINLKGIVCINAPK